MGSQPTAEERPTAFHGVDMHFALAVSIFIASVFAAAVIHRPMLIPPFGQTRVDVILVGVDQRSGSHFLFDDGRDGLLLDVG